MQDLQLLKVYLEMGKSILYRVYVCKLHTKACSSGESCLRNEKKKKKTQKETS